MDLNNVIDRLSSIENKLESNETKSLLQKKVLSFREACQYLDLSSSYLYKMTSLKLIPHYCPGGKRIYFDRKELDAWLLRNRQASREEIEQEAANYVNRKK